MVVFTCQNCNASLKRAVVAKHYTTVCRRAIHLTCIDCLKDFRGQEYNNHTSCITEDERYGDKNFKPKPTAVKQTKWMDVVHSCAQRNENPKFKFIFSKLSSYTNVPRKRDKFMNFIKSSLPRFSQDISGEVFDIIMEEFTKQNKGNSEEDVSPEKNLDSSGHKLVNEESEKKKKKKRNENSESIEVQNNDEGADNEKKKKNKKSKSNEVLNHNDENFETEVLNKKKKKFKMSESFSPEKVEALKSGDFSAIFNIKADGTKRKSDVSHKSNDESDEKENVQDNSVSSELDKNEMHDEVVNKEKLSKKELKKLKKKQKFEAELKEIESSQNDASNNENNDEVTPENIAKISKKSKKRKAALSESETDGGKKQKVEENEEINNGIENEEEGEEDEQKQNKAKAKFNWEEVIKEILRKSSDHEMSIKRISKKVLAEYQAVKGERESYEQLISKFNKKINKIAGIRVLKDKAKLLSEE